MVNKKESLGEKIGSLRRHHNLSMAEVADRTGIAESTLAGIERDELIPPLGNIISLASAFGVEVGELFGDSGDSPFCIVRSEDRQEVPRFSDAYSKSCGYSYQGLGQQKRNRQMEPFLVTLSPDQEDEARENQHIGEEFIFVLQGKVEISLADHKDILNPGDSIYYDSNVPHIVSCHGDEPATMLAVIYAKEEMIIL